MHILLPRASSSATASKGECCSWVVNHLAQLTPPMLDLFIPRIAGRFRFCLWQGVYMFVTVVNQGWIWVIHNLAFKCGQACYNWGVTCSAKSCDCSPLTKLCRKMNTPGRQLFRVNRIYFDLALLNGLYMCFTNLFHACSNAESFLYALANSVMFL